MDVLMHTEGNQIVETAVEARGWLLGGQTLVVLFVSTVLTVGLFAFIYVLAFWN